MTDTIRRPDWLSPDVWPWPVQAVPTPAGRLAVTDTGSGPALLLAHIGSWSPVWRDLVSDLSTDFRVVTFDTPGIGLSERLRKGEVSLARAADGVTALVEALALDRFTLVVHDLAGPVGLAAVELMPERVEGIVAINTFGWRPDGRHFRGMLRLMGSGPVRAIDVTTRLLPRVSASGFGAGRHWTPAQRRGYRRGLDAGAVRTWHRYFRDAARSADVYERVTRVLTGQLSNRPMLTVFGERNDPLHFQPRWRALFPTAVQRVVPRGNHYPMGDDPQQVAAWIREWHRGAVAYRIRPAERAAAAASSMRSRS